MLPLRLGLLGVLTQLPRARDRRNTRCRREGAIRPIITTGIPIALTSETVRALIEQAVGELECVLRVRSWTWVRRDGAGDDEQSQAKKAKALRGRPRVRTMLVG